MNWYPQIGSGSLAQFPLGRSRQWRAFTNWLENDERVVLADAASNHIEWTLKYRELSDAEATALRNLFTASEGCFGAFGFIDPTANLIGSSSDLTQPVWNAGLMAAGGGNSDPTGGSSAWNLTNSAPGPQSLQQTLEVPADYMVCFSMWLQSETYTSVTLGRDDVQQPVVAGPVWARHFVSGRASGTGSSSVLSITVPAGQTVRVWGPQAEVQPYPSQYKPTLAVGGIYPETYFAKDELTITSTAPGLSSCDVTLVSRG